MEFKHIPVLFRESIDALDIKPDGLYADCTAGGGGHSNAILDRLSGNGRLVAIDRDPEAIETLTKRFEGRENVSIVNDNFFNIKSILSQFTDEGADGILADLGVSSHQLDDAARGFSFHADAPLDMRMSMQGMSAADAVNSLSQRELQDIIYRYGEDKFAPRIAAGIVRARAEKPIETTFELNEIIKASIPAKVRATGGHPSKRTYQAIRIELNRELDVLENSIDMMIDRLKPQGRLCIITFHSLEDRIVKARFRNNENPCTCPPDFPVCVCGKKSKGKVITRKPIVPGDEELNENQRSKSSKLRVFERI